MTVIVYASLGELNNYTSNRSARKIEKAVYCRHQFYINAITKQKIQVQKVTTVQSNVFGHTSGILNPNFMNINRQASPYYTESQTKFKHDLTLQL